MYMYMLLYRYVCVHVYGTEEMCMYCMCSYVCAQLTWSLGPSNAKQLHVNSFKETRQSKQLHPKTTPFLLERKNELPRAGFEPATFCVLGKHSTNCMYT